jgi:hypothetical protein
MSFPHAPAVTWRLDPCGTEVVGADLDLADAAAKAPAADMARHFGETVGELFESFLLHRLSLVRACALMQRLSEFTFAAAQ